MPQPRKWLLALLMLSVTAVWGYTFTAVQDAVAGYGVMAFLALRFTLAAAVMTPVGLPRRDPRLWRNGGLIGLVLAGSYIFQTFGLRYTSAANSGLITGLFLIFAVVWNRVLYRVRVGRRAMLAAVASLAGLALLTGAASRPNLGDLLTLACGCTFGLHVALLDRHSRGHDAVALAWAQITVAAVVFLAVWPLVDPLVLPRAEVWGAIVLTGVVASAVGFLAQTAVQRALSAVKVALILTMEPVFAAGFGWWLGGERPQAVQVLGGMVMVGALFVSVLPARQRPDPTRSAAACTPPGCPPSAMHRHD